MKEIKGRISQVEFMTDLDEMDGWIEREREILILCQFPIPNYIKQSKYEVLT